MQGEQDAVSTAVMRLRRAEGQIAGVIRILDGEAARTRRPTTSATSLSIPLAELRARTAEIDLERCWWATSTDPSSSFARPVREPCRPVSTRRGVQRWALERQVRLVAGGLVLLGVGLSLACASSSCPERARSAGLLGWPCTW